MAKPFGHSRSASSRSQSGKTVVRQDKNPKPANPSSGRYVANTNEGARITKDLNWGQILQTKK